MYKYHNYLCIIACIYIIDTQLGTFDAQRVTAEEGSRACNVLLLTSMPCELLAPFQIRRRAMSLYNIIVKKQV